MSDFPGANLAAFLNYDDGMSKTEAEADILRVVFQTQGLTKYDRKNGGSFEDIEQEQSNDSVILLFVTNVISSIYRMNERRKFKPFTVMGYEDISQEVIKGKNVIRLSYTFLQNLKNIGSVAVPTT